MKLDLNKKDIVNILDNYSIGKYKSHKKLWWSLDNLIYVTNTDKGNFILKYFKNSEPKHVLWTLKLMEKMRKKRLPIAETFKNKKGKFISRYKGKQLIIQKFVGGTRLKEADSRFIKEFAKSLGMLDKYLMNVKLKGKYLWNKMGHQFEPSFYRSKDIIDEFDYKSEEERLIKELNKNVQKEKLRKSIIHSDYTLTNLVIKNNKIAAILDWDDMHEDYLAFEPAIAVNHLFFIDKKANIEYLKNFFKEYEKYVRLNTEEKKAIYYFIKIRILSNVVWCDLQRKKHGDKARKLSKWLKGVIESYSDFNKISLEEFLQLSER